MKILSSRMGSMMKRQWDEKNQKMESGISSESGELHDMGAVNFLKA